MTINWDILGKAAKEFGRVILLAIIPVLLMGINLESGAIVINWLLVQAFALVAALKFIDKLLHEVGKTKGNEKYLTGLTRF